MASALRELFQEPMRSHCLGNALRLLDVDVPQIAVWRLQGPRFQSLQIYTHDGDNSNYAYIERVKPQELDYAMIISAKVSYNKSKNISQ